MKGGLRYWRYLLQAMFTPPWKPIYDLEGRELDAFNLWFAGWGYSLFGIAALGIVAPFWVQGLRIPSQYQEGVIIGIACMGGFIWQAAILLVYATVWRWVVSISSSISSLVVGWSVALLLSFCVCLPVFITGLVFVLVPKQDVFGPGTLGGIFLKLVFTFAPSLIKSLIFSRLLQLAKRLMWGQRTTPIVKNPL